MDHADLVLFAQAKISRGLCLAALNQLGRRLKRCGESKTPNAYDGFDGRDVQ